MDEWKWSSRQQYYGKYNERRELLDPEFILAIESFKEFNERVNNDQCLDDQINKRRFTDVEAREVTKTILNGIEIAQVKSLSGSKRNEILKRTLGIKGLLQRQTARILGVSRTLISKV